ncbi:hypothetical protein I4F81_010941 [Pyropia yezoensis]|uniref:Uncharacterized protein n=1 Tax=Pyropia yezoensis TaxID=2788 RepID=A0ACC3CE63_PYRYE|nr:hypothetical protein I4F81_010941 [Neopyropia yezoensis]
MGRRGRTGPGGAVVSSLSTNAGGTVGAKKNKAGGGLPGGAGSTSARGGGSGNAAADDVDIVFGSGSSSRASKKGAAAAAAAGDPEEEAEAEATVAAGGKARAVHKPKPSKWLGKQPSDFLQEWCEKNNRKRHFIKDANNAPPGSRICIVPPGRRKPNKKAGGPDPDKAITGGYQDSDEAAALATLHILIEDVLLRSGVAAAGVSVVVPTRGAAAAPAASDDPRVADIVRRLVAMGFTPSDARPAAVATAGAPLGAAVERLCLTLDDAELPPAFAPTPDVEVAILDAIVDHDVTIVRGMTGSGKSTQVPQFLLEDAAPGAPVNVIVTQPRRIAAISVATRVAAERGERVGGSIGYRIRGESAVSTATKVTFVTTGVLLRQLSNYREALTGGDGRRGDGDGGADVFEDLLEGTTHVVVDEVHERAVDTDLILLLLRDALAAHSTRAKVVLMSATVDAVKLGGYFSSGASVGIVGGVVAGKAVVAGGGRLKSTAAPASPRSIVPVVDIPGRTFPVTQLYLEDALRLTGYRLRPGSRYAKSRAAVAKEERAAKAAAGGVLQERKLTPPITADERATLGSVDPTQINLELLEDTVYALDDAGRGHFRCEGGSPGGPYGSLSACVGDGAILVFLSGVADITALVRRLSTGAAAARLHALPLHAGLSPGDQARVFAAPPAGTRKVVVSTNVAETSVTVADITAVVDTCRVKEARHDAAAGSGLLADAFVSRAAARQRAGRAGRTQAGVCVRLIPAALWSAPPPPPPPSSAADGGGGASDAAAAAADAASWMAEDSTPEMSRVALDQLVLRVAAAQPTKHPRAVLAGALDPPPAEAVEVALRRLAALAALYPHVLRADTPDDSYTDTAGGAVRKAVRAVDVKLRSADYSRAFLFPDCVLFDVGELPSRWLVLAVHANAGTLVMDGWAAFRAPAKTALLVAAARDRLDGLLARKCDAPGEEVLGGDGAAVIDAIVRMLVDS